MKTPALGFVCPKSFDSMPGTTIRHCAECERDVTDLSALTEAEARRAVASGGCVSFESDAVGNVRFAPRRALRVLRPMALLAAVSAVACSRPGRTTGELAPVGVTPGASCTTETIGPPAASASTVSAGPPAPSAR